MKALRFVAALSLAVFVGMGAISAQEGEKKAPAKEEKKEAPAKNDGEAKSVQYSMNITGL